MRWGIAAIGCEIVCLGTIVTLCLGLAPLPVLFGTYIVASSVVKVCMTMFTRGEVKWWMNLTRQAVDACNDRKVICEDLIGLVRRMTGRLQGVDALSEKDEYTTLQ